MKLLEAGTLSRQIAERYRGGSEPEAEQGVVRGSWTKKCDVELYYLMRREKYTDPPDAITQNRMEKGTRYHDWFQKTLIPECTSYRLTHVEETLEMTIGSITLKGHIDGVLEQRLKNAPDGSEVWVPIALIDFKTTSEFGYKGSASALKKGGDPLHYSWSYYTQLNRYLRMWNAKYPDQQLDTVVIFLYNVNGTVDKDTGFCSNDFWIRPSMVDFKRDIKRLEAVWGMKREPERPYKEDSWECKGCWYRTKCWGAVAHG